MIIRKSNIVENNGIVELLYLKLIICDIFMYVVMTVRVIVSSWFYNEYERTINVSSM